MTMPSPNDPTYAPWCEREARACRRWAAAMAVVVCLMAAAFVVLAVLGQTAWSLPPCAVLIAVSHGSLLNSAKRFDLLAERWRTP